MPSLVRSTRWSKRNEMALQMTSSTVSKISEETQRVMKLDNLCFITSPYCFFSSTWNTVSARKKQEPDRK